MAEESVLHSQARPKPPRHCLVHFGSGDLPGILLEWRPKRDHGGVSRFEGLVIYASQEYAPPWGWAVTQGWLDGDMIRPVG